jgi:ComF family protein
MRVSPIEPILSFALPPRCPGCGVVTTAEHRFCVACWTSLRFLAPPWCAGCHVPFAYDRGAGARCGDCLANPPRHAGVDAAVVYGPVARTVVLRLKYGGRAAFADTAARLMARHLPRDAALIVPVPLHRWRLWSRGYNQAALIAAALSRMSAVPSDAALLVRRRATPVLRGIGAAERRQAVRGAFATSPNARERIAGRSIVLVDDVYTSGATTDACVATLLAGGAARVSVLCWARVLEATEMD